MSITVEKQIAAGANNGYRYSGSSGFAANPWDMLLGYYTNATSLHCNGFFLWDLGEVVSGTISVAYIKAMANYNPVGTAQLKVYFVNEAMPAAPTTAAQFDADPLTTGVDWDGAWTADAWQTSSSLVTDLQAVVTAFGSVSIVMVQIKNDWSPGADNYQSGVFGWKTDPTKAAIIHIEYTPPVTSRGSIRALI